MTATYTFDVFSTLDGYGSYNEDGDSGGYWGKHGPEFIERRLALYAATNGAWSQHLPAVRAADGPDHRGVDGD